MALANVAWILAATGLRVLTIDWDLEAPGLHRYFRPFMRDPDLIDSKGLIDLLWEYSDLVLKPKESWPADVVDPILFTDPYRYIIPLEWPLPGVDGCVHLLCAGRQDAGYGGQVRDFDWRAFYERLGGDSFIEALRTRLNYDFVLIDSRTGVADTSGICTLQLPDQVVLCFTYNRQSIKGVEAVADAIQGRSHRPIRLVPVAMRVEKGVSTIGLARSFARECLDRFLAADWSEEELQNYWTNCEISHYPNYAFEETIALFREVAAQRTGPLADMTWITAQVLGRDNAQLPRILPETQERYLRRIAFRDPRIAELDELLTNWSVSEGSSRISELVTQTLRDGEFDIEYRKALADAALAIASRFQEVGERTGALAVSRDAAELYRTLAEQRPNTYRPLLAMSLNNLANRLSELGDREAALAAAREAVDIRRALAAQRPDAFWPDLAGSLNNLANTLSELGEREAALAAAREAADLYRALAAQRPDAFRPDLAMSLNNLANRLSELGEREAALAAAREAADLYRALAAQRPDAFRPNLAGSLNNLAAMLSELGEREAALATAREAADLYRALAAQRPDAFRPNLAGSLNNLATMLSELGEREAALAAAREAAELYRALAAQRPDAFRPDLAMSLNNLATMLSELGEQEAALATAREAAELYRALAAQRPDAFRPNLAGSLNNLAAMLSELGEREAALAAAREAVDLYRALAAQRPDAFRPLLAMSLNNLANTLSELGEREAALAVAREAAELYRALAAQRPDAFRPDLAMSLNNLANRLSQLGEREAALAAAREAVDIRRALAAQRPDAFRPDLAVSLWVLADSLDAVDRRDEGLAANAGAIAELSDMFQRHKRAFAGQIAGMVQEYRRRCEALGREPDAALLAPVAAGLAEFQSSPETPA
ncbi:MAG TPA: tetratricopeptide repeat protein [Acetobacteraceae bacterium]|nr:tetratricopeptide repeat protein [Acetobacteraceae bacterium]